MRAQINASLNTAMKAKDTRRTSTLRLVNAAIKDRDIAARGDGKENIDDAEILALLQKMVKQRDESIAIYEKAAREDLASQEREEVAIIKDFLPQPLNEEDVKAAIAEAIEAVGATGLRDMGKVVTVLKEKFPGRIDFAKASKLVKDSLAG